jgi:hypothetical protein
MANRRDPNARWWQMMELFQKNSLEFAIDYCGGVNKAAKYLGLNHGYVYRLCKKLGVDSSIRPYNKQDEAEVEDAVEATDDDRDSVVDDATEEAEAPWEGDSFDDDDDDDDDEDDDSDDSDDDEDDDEDDDDDESVDAYATDYDEDDDGGLVRFFVKD